MSYSPRLREERETDRPKVAVSTARSMSENKEILSAP